MTLKQFLADLTVSRDSTPASNLGWLRQRLDSGDLAHSATLHEGDMGPWPGPLLMIELGADDERVSLPISLDKESIQFLRTRLPRLRLSFDECDGDGKNTDSTPSGSPLQREMARLLADAEKLPPDERAAPLIDWIMERIDASRCALIPFESGTPGAPLAFHTRGRQPSTSDVRRVPRKIVAHVARNRQPRVSHRVGDADAADQNETPDATAVRQQVRSYMAVPVVFRGDLLAVCYVDRFDRPEKFTADEQAIFEAFAYELSWPLLGLRDEQRRHEYRELRDLMLQDDDGKAPGLISSPALDETLDRARKLAPYVSENLLILGETGVGKEVVARFIHEHSGRAEAAFVAVNVSAISAELFESELMGSVRGAFTGAVDRPGRVAEAHSGTLFLDEIGDLALQNQVKLLRFLQEKRARPVGGKTTRPVDVRVIAATNRPIEELVELGDFREDLFHRFAPPLTVPPLRKRRAEIVPHANAWQRSKARQAGVREPTFTPEAQQFLEDYPWPGNVRQLEAVVSHAVLLSSSSTIGKSLLESLVPAPPAEVDGPDPTTWDQWKAWRDAQETTWLKKIVDQHHGRVAAAARAIGVPLSTLRSLLKRHGLRE